ncbi:ribonuclease H1-like isoform X2 [Macrosteles quadrilineatus]|uniref:ribonuclease H1-like isoform X2 n=1 Tax=Macrosteles quadrilineatus TaxID=74068 RepID=UPI0023E224EC|nr:ribonuclease H1-like isoform X2 [Macrosteles quadrilineatus]
MPFYAVVSGKNPGIYTNWDDCREQITNYPGAWYKKFKTEHEADKCMKSKDIALRSSGLAAYTPQKIADYSVPIWASRNTAKYSSPDTFSVNLRTNKTEEKYDKKKRCYDKCPDYYTVKVPGLYDRMNYIEKNATSLYTSNWLHAIHTNQIYVPPLIEDYEGFIDVYIDGAVSRKRGVKPRGGIGVWFNHEHPLNVTAPIEGVVSPINAEIQAATRAIQQAAAAGLTRLNIHTDSLYLVKSITEWIKMWKRNHWQTNTGKTVKYRGALERLSHIKGCMEAVRWIHIKSHQGNEGNECADTLARNGVNIHGINKYSAYSV